MNNRGRSIFPFAKISLPGRWRWLMVSTLLLFTCWGAIACHSVPATESQTNVQVNCHGVEHGAGITCVPNTIQRLVVLDQVSLEYALALGFHPVGAPLSQRKAYLRDRLIGVETIGEGGTPNLERVLALKPDLIVGLDFNQAIYAQASQIAPTLLIPFTYSGEWKEAFQRFSTALDREEIGQQVMHQYQQRLRNLQNTLKEMNSAQGLSFPFKVSVVRIYPDKLSLYFRDSFCGIILQDAGLLRPNAQDLSASEAKRWFNNEIQESISLEQVDQADGDVMFAWTSEDSVAADQSAKERFAKLQTAPLWQQLNAIKMDRVYFVPDYWIGSGPLAANAVIDDLFRYLVNPS